MAGYVVVIEGDDESGYSAYSPDLPHVVAAGATRPETEHRMRAALADYLALLRATGHPVPEPMHRAGVVLLDPAAA